MAAQSDAVNSIDDPEQTLIINGNSVMAMCEAVRSLKEIKKIKVFQANSAELFRGLTQHASDILRIDETILEFYPKNPYAIAKLMAYWIIRYYREYYDLYMCNGIIFNAESPRRNPKFVVNKIARTVRKILTNNDLQLVMGDLEAKRDWIHAYDVAMAAWISLQQPNSDDYVISLNQYHSVRDTIQEAFSVVGINVEWELTKQTGVEKETGRVLVVTNRELFRSYEIKTVALIGDNSKLLSRGWIPKYTWESMIREMVLC